MENQNYLINDQLYSRQELLQFSEDIRQNNPAAWENKLFLFISDYLSDSESITVQTSGTTGSRREFDVPKWKFKLSAKQTASFFQLKPGETCLSCLPVDYIAGKMVVVRALELGLNLHYTEPRSNPLTDSLGKIDFSAMVPLQVRHILEESPDKLNLLQTLLIGGGRVSPDLELKLKDYSCRVFETFGMTETLTHFAVREVNGNGKESFETLPGVTIALDHRNCLVAKAPWFIEPSVVTSDIVELNGSGLFKWLGRIDNVINSGGVLVYPEQVEERLQNIIGDIPFFIQGLPDEQLGERVAIFLEGTRDLEPIINAKLESAKNLLPGKFEFPRQMVFLNQFLRTSSGKIRRRETVNKLYSAV